jgi:hypothetical protein
MSRLVSKSTKRDGFMSRLLGAREGISRHRYCMRFAEESKRCVRDRFPATPTV